MRNSRLIYLVPLLAATALPAAGCYARAGGYAGTRPVVFTEQPSLVYVDSNVWVVRDSPQPVYYVDGNYYAYTDDTWYRSDSYDGDWVVVESNTVPTSIIHRDHYTYVNFEGGETATVRPAPRGPEMAPAAGTTPPGQRWIPPGQQRIPPGQRAVPPGQQRTPPGQRAMPPGQQRVPPGQRAVPPGQRGAPPSATPPEQRTPPGRSGTPPGRGAAPPARPEVPPSAAPAPERGAPDRGPERDRGAAPSEPPDQGAAPAPKRPPEKARGKSQQREREEREERERREQKGKNR